MTATTWQVDPHHATLGLTVRHMLISKVHGRFTRWTARLQFDPAELDRSTVEVEVEAASIDTGVAARDEHLRSADFLDVAHHPSLRYLSRRVEVVSPARLRVVGDLTVRGVTHEVVLDVVYAGQAKDLSHSDRAGFSATASFDRKVFGLIWNQALETGGFLVADRVDVEIELEAVRQAVATVA